MAIFPRIPALRPPAKYGSDNVIITWQDNTFFTLQFRDMELKIMGGASQRQ